MNKNKNLGYVFFTLLIFILPVFASPLPRSTPEKEGIESAGILALVNTLDANIDAVHSLMIVRNGKVVTEGWWAPYQKNDVHILYSLTKSVTSTGIGMAVDEGLLSPNDLVSSFFPQKMPEHPSANMKEMRVRDLLTMTSGHDYDTITPLKRRLDGQWVEAFLETHVAFRPGIHFQYNSGASYVLTAILQKATGVSALDYLQPRLFDALGFSDVKWYTSVEGVNYGDGGMKATTEDIAKLGQLYLQKGQWHGKTLVSKQWVASATSRQTSTGSDENGNWNHGYGYQFWLNKVGGYRADGAFGQFAIVLPEHNMVVAITSGTEDTNKILDAVWQHLLPAVHTKKIKKNKQAFKALTTKLSSLTLPLVVGEKTSATMAMAHNQRYLFRKNAQQIDWIEVGFNKDNTIIKMKDHRGEHRLTSGYQRWLEGKTHYQRDISRVFDDPNQPIAMCGAWTRPNTYTAKLIFKETPYYLTLNLTFNKNHMLFDLAQNASWDEKKHKRLRSLNKNNL